MTDTLPDNLIGLCLLVLSLGLKDGLKIGEAVEVPGSPLVTAPW